VIDEATEVPRPEDWLNPPGRGRKKPPLDPFKEMDMDTQQTTETNAPDRSFLGWNATIPISEGADPQDEWDPWKDVKLPLVGLRGTDGSEFWPSSAGGPGWAVFNGSKDEVNEIIRRAREKVMQDEREKAEQDKAEKDKATNEFSSL
jgi:hypothetical protein